MSRSVPVKVLPQPAVNATGSRNRRVLPLTAGEFGFAAEAPRNARDGQLFDR